MNRFALLASAACTFVSANAFAGDCYGNIGSFRYDFVMSEFNARSIDITKTNDRSFFASVALTGGATYAFLNGQKIFVYGTGSVSAGKLFLFSYVDSLGADGIVRIKHDGVGEGVLDCSFEPNN